MTTRTPWQDRVAKYIKELIQPLRVAERAQNITGSPPWSILLVHFAYERARGAHFQYVPALSHRNSTDGFSESALTAMQRLPILLTVRLTGRHQPAAREHSHLFGLSRVRYAPSFSLVSAGHRRFMKGGRNDQIEISSIPSVSRIPP